MSRFKNPLSFPPILLVKALALALYIMLASCAGGSSVNVENTNGGETPTVVITNSTPTISLGEDFGAFERQTIALVATANDADGDTLSFQWELLDAGGTNLILPVTTASSLTFTTPNIVNVTSITVQLTVSDASASATDSINIDLNNRSRILFGPIEGATVSIALMSAPDTIIETTRSLSSDEVDDVVNDAGLFSFDLDGVDDNEWMIATSVGGIDIDPNDDQVFEPAEARANIGTQRAIGRAMDFRNGVFINILSELSVIELERLSTPLGSLDQELIEQTINSVATQFIDTDLTNDNTIDFTDLLTFSAYDNTAQLRVNYEKQLLPIAQSLTFGALAIQINTGASPDSLIPIASNIALNAPPEITAIPTQSVTLGSNVNIAAIVNENVSFSWEQIAGESIAFSGADTSNIEFDVPGSFAAGQTLVFMLTVTDTQLAQETILANVFINSDNFLPTVALQESFSATENTQLVLTATGDDQDGFIQGYLWINETNDTNNVNFPILFEESITVTLPEVCAAGGTARVTVLATDNRGGSATATTTIFIVDDNNLPSVAFDITDGTVVNDNTIFTINSIVSDPDSFVLCGDILNYSWVQTQGPSVSNITSPNGPQAQSFTMQLPDVSASGATITFELIVLDAASESAQGSISFFVQNVNRAPNVTVSASSTAIDEGNVVTLTATPTDIDNGDFVQSIEWRQISGTAVTLSNTNTNVITFTAPDIDSTTETLIFEAVVTDNSGATAFASIDIVVNNVILPVGISTTNQSLTSTFALSVTGTISATITGTDTNTFDINIVQQPASGTLTLSTDITATFNYTLSSNDADALNVLINGTSFAFTVQLNNQLVSQTAVFTINFRDISSAMVNLSPMNNAINISTSPTIVLSSSLLPLNFSDFTVNSSSTACTGTIQLRLLSSSNCIPLQIQESTNLGRQITIRPLEQLLPNAQYTLNVQSLTSIFGAPTANFGHIFTTANGNLLITEVAVSTQNNQARWFELFNPSNERVNLNNFALRSRVINSDNNTNNTMTFSAFPNVILEPGNFVVVRAQNADADQQFIDGPGIVHIGNANNRPFWDSSGFIEIINITGDTSATEDYVIFGSRVPDPITPSAWLAISAVPAINQTPGFALARNASNSDTNGIADWSESSFSTPAGPNDVSSAVDTDLDGIPDVSEAFGSTYAGIMLSNTNTMLLTNRREILVEVDFMESLAGEELSPRLEALDIVVDRFRDLGIEVYFDVGTRLAEALNAQLPNQLNNVTNIIDMGGGNEVSFIESVGFERNNSSMVNVTSFYDIKLQNFDLRRLGIFHYLLFANSQSLDGNLASNGSAEINGNDMLVTLGDRNLSSNAPEFTNQLIHAQAASVMHQLGHNLGLLHGGNDNVDYKPNYLSVMNNLYQLSGIPDITSNAGDRYFQSVFTGQPSASNCVPTTLTFNAETADFVTNFSDGSSQPLDETNLDESFGLNRTGSTAVDFNCDGDNTDGVSSTFAFNINPQDNNTASTLTVLVDHNDGTNLDLIFQDNAINAANRPAPQNTSQQDSLQLAPNGQFRDQEAVWSR